MAKLRSVSSPNLSHPSVETDVEADPVRETAQQDAGTRDDKVTALQALSREDLIRESAYRKFQDRSGGAGDAVQDWLQAEKEVDSKSVVKPRLEP